PDERESLQQRACDARVEDIADDRDVEPVELVEFLPQRVEIQQRLRRMLMLAVPCVDDVRVGETWDELRRADLRVPDHDHVGVVRAERERGVLQRLALVHRGTRRLDRERVRREALRRELERGRRAGRGLVEEVDDQVALERRQLLHVAVERGLEGARGPEQALDVFAREVTDRKEMPLGRVSRWTEVVADETNHLLSSSGLATSRTPSTSSTSTSCTWIRS